jgi:hypothetical protein
MEINLMRRDINNGKKASFTDCHSAICTGSCSANPTANDADSAANRTHSTACEPAGNAHPARMSTFPNTTRLLPANV